MEALIYFVVWGALIFVMMRYGCGAHLLRPYHDTQKPGGKAGSSDQLRWIAPKKATDPVCRTSVVTTKAKPSVYGGEVYYFCSRDCREIFEAAPETYLDGSSSVTSPLLERSRVRS